MSLECTKRNLTIHLWEKAGFSISPISLNIQWCSDPESSNSLVPFMAATLSQKGWTKNTASLNNESHLQRSHTENFSRKSHIGMIFQDWAIPTCPRLSMRDWNDDWTSESIWSHAQQKHFFLFPLKVLVKYFLGKLSISDVLHSILVWTPRSRGGFQTISVVVTSFQSSIVRAHHITFTLILFQELRENHSVKFLPRGP